MTFLMINILLSVANSEECLCKNGRRGEVCGEELNELNNSTVCEKHYYFCSNSNANNKAIVLKKCDVGKECDKRNWAFSMLSINWIYYFLGIKNFFIDFKENLFFSL